MTSHFQEKKATYFLFIILLFVLLAVLYFAFLRPILHDSRAAESNMLSLETDVENLRKQLDAEPEEKAINTFQLEKQVPLTRELEALLLTFQEIELLSGSRIESIKFIYDENLDEDKVEREQADSMNEENTNEESNEESSEKSNMQPKGQQVLPDNLKTVTAELIVTSPDYERFMQFLKEIEQLKRITFVEKLEFVKPAEGQLILEEKPFHDVPFNIQITTFYYEEQ